MELSVLSPSSSQWLFPRNPKPSSNTQIRTKSCSGWRIQVSMGDFGESCQKHTKIVTFLGKGGSGKTTASVLAAKLYAREGLQTCLVIHSQDIITAEQLMGCTIGNSPTMISENLFAVQLQTSKMLLEPLDRMKKVDARMNLTQGILEGVVGEELGVLPGMDSIFSLLALQKYGNFLTSGKNYSKKEFDIVVYDGSSSEDTLRLVGATERVRWYLKYIRNLAEKTDIGRLTAPSFLRLVYESARPNPGPVEGKTSTDIWNEIEQILEEASAYFCDSSRFRCYLLMNPSRPLSVTSALRYWGCAIQAGIKIYGAFGFAPKFSSATQETMEKLSPLCFALLPYISSCSSLDWDVTLNSFSKDANHLLLGSTISPHSLVLFDHKQKSVTLFLPGFKKSEIKLFQVSGSFQSVREALVHITNRIRETFFPPKHYPNIGMSQYLSIVPEMMPSCMPRNDAPPVRYAAVGFPHALDPSIESPRKLPASSPKLRTPQSGNPKGVAVGSATQAGIAPSKTVTIAVPQHYMGFVHGESDGNLALIREVSGADVTVHDPKPGTHEGSIVISGSQKQATTAQGLLHAFILNEL